MLPHLLLWIVHWPILSDASTPSLTGGLGDPWTFLAGQGVLGLVAGLIYREYRDEKAKREAMTEKIITDIIPLLTRVTEVLERSRRQEELKDEAEAMASALQKRPAPRSRSKRSPS